MEVGDGVVDTQTIDATNLMARPASISTANAIMRGSGTDGNWSTGTYAYDAAGNITAMGAQPFHYDGVSRLTSGTVTGFGSESYTYDPYGNLTSAGSIVLTTDPATNHLDAAVTGAAYDGAGNLTSFGLSGSTTTYTYDDLNQLASVFGSGVNRSQAYTADGERLFVRDGPTYLVTLRDLGGNVIREVEYTTSGGWRWRRDNVYRGGLLLASQGREEGIQHYHLDHLGSPWLVTSRTGEQLRLFATSPFGKDPTATQSSERMRFTVHERDVGQLSDVLDDIDYMHARSYSPRLGRFLSLDPVRGGQSSPQSFNLFAYVRNNPSRKTDPSGLAPQDETKPDPKKKDGECPDPKDKSDPDCSGQPRQEDYPKIAVRVSEEFFFSTEGRAILMKIVSGKALTLKEQVALYADIARNSMVVPIEGVCLGGSPRVLQGGGRTIRNATARALGLERREAGRALEAMKDYYGLPSDFHSSKILANGDVVNSETGEIIDNLFAFLL
ncbi:MAG: RHS repeat domain-containing protein [Thermoanaerobaculaceae bacterium]